MQITNGVRRILSLPQIYSGFQYLMGAHSGWLKIVNEFIKPNNTFVMLDIGCGTCDVLDYLPKNIEYWGFDISEDYIQKAKQKYSHRGNFFAKILTQQDLISMPEFDVVLMSGVLHHLDDAQSKQAISLSKKALKAGGRLITIDPCYVNGQNPIARFLISKDRGQNVRDEIGYKNLVNHEFPHHIITIKHKSWIPYTHCYMECTK